jgi:hypothetical protein
LRFFYTAFCTCLSSFGIATSEVDSTSRLRIFFALSVFFHGAVIAALFFIQERQIPEKEIIHAVELQARGSAGSVRVRIPYNDLSPILSPEGRKFDPTGIFSGPAVESAGRPSKTPHLETPWSAEIGNSRPGGGFSTGFDNKKYTTLEAHQVKIAEIVKSADTLWLNSGKKRERVREKLLDFFNGKVRMNTWYTLGIGSRPPDESEQKELIYYLRRLELKVREDGAAEQANNLANLCKIVYENLIPELQKYWESLSGNYLILNDLTRSPER